jgi:hypothetical protein
MMDEACCTPSTSINDGHRRRMPFFGADTRHSALSWCDRRDGKSRARLVGDHEYATSGLILLQNAAEVALPRRSARDLHFQYSEFFIE